MPKHCSIGTLFLFLLSWYVWSLQWLEISPMVMAPKLTFVLFICLSYFLDNGRWFLSICIVPWFILRGLFISLWLDLGSYFVIQAPASQCFAIVSPGITLHIRIFLHTALCSIYIVIWHVILDSYLYLSQAYIVEIMFLLIITIYYSFTVSEKTRILFLDFVVLGYLV